MPVASSLEAAPGRGREGDAAERDLGDGPDVRAGEWLDLLLHELHRRVLALHCAPRVVAGDGRGDGGTGGPEGDRRAAERGGRLAAGEAVDSFGQRQRLRVEGVQGGVEGERSGPPA